MDTSMFSDKAVIPNDEMLAEAIGELHSTWCEIRDYVFNVFPQAMEEWNFPGQKYGWSFRIKDKKRAIVYLLPRDKYFMVAFVFGEKATHLAMQSDISSEIKFIIDSARVYAEGRGFRIEVRNPGIVSDIENLIDLKISC